MKQRILFICTTYYQLILAIHMSNTIKKDCLVDVIITDNSNNAKSIVDNINKHHVCNQAFFASIKDIDKLGRNKISCLKDVFSASFGFNKLLNNILSNNYYDEIIFYTHNMFTYIVYAYISRINPNVRASRFEEGITSYNLSYHVGECKKTKLLRFIRHLLHKKVLDDIIKSFYCIYPELYHGPFDIIKIPNFSNQNTLKEDINNAFGINQIEEINERFIFLSTSHDLKKDKKINEKKLIESVINIVGKDNLIVKVHPRCNPDDLLDLGVKVMSQSTIPWEVYLLNLDLREHVLLTSISGSVLSVDLMNKKGPTVLFLYNLLDLSKNERVQGMINAYKEIKNTINSNGINRIKEVMTFKELEAICTKNSF